MVINWMGGFYKMESAILSIITTMEESIRDLKKNQQTQADTIDNIIKVTKDLQDDVKKTREGIK